MIVWRGYCEWFESLGEKNVTSPNKYGVYDWTPIGRVRVRSNGSVISLNLNFTVVKRN